MKEAIKTFLLTFSLAAIAVLAYHLMRLQEQVILNQTYIKSLQESVIFLLNK